MLEKLVQSLENQIEFQEFKLTSLLEITNAINTKQSVETLTKILEFILKEQLGFSKFILLHKQDSWKTLLKTGVKGSLKEDEILENLARFREITTIESSPSEIIAQFDNIVPVFHQKAPLAYLLILETL